GLMGGWAVGWNGSPHVSEMAATTCSKLTGRPRTATTVVSPPAGNGWVPSSRIDPCCKNACLRRACAEPTSLRPFTRISPPTEDAKQDAGWADGRMGRWAGASTASTERARKALASRVWISQYAFRSDPNTALAATKAYLSPFSCHAACPPVG